MRERERQTKRERERVTETEKERQRGRGGEKRVYVCVCVCVCVSWRGFKVPQAKPRVKMAGPENSLLLGKQDKTTSPNV